MTNSLAQIGSAWIWILAIIGLLVLMVIVLASGLVRKAAAPPAEDDKPKDKTPPAEPEAGAPEPEREPAPAESASTSFKRAMAFLRQTVTGRDYRYQLPWLLTIGDPGSGKFSFMSGVGLNLCAEERRRHPNRPLHWHFLDEGVLIGVSGQYIKGGSRREYNWGKLLGQLQNNRPRRPFDGVILAIPASDLAGPHALEEPQLIARAARFSELLAEAQRTTGFTFPVYVVVTKCDGIDGFSEFCRELPPSELDGIFGWSCSYHVDAAFSPDWVDEAFESTARDLARLQSEIFVERSSLRRPEKIFLFPENFARLRPALFTYLDRLFRETAYRDAFRFRGIYFAGDPGDAETLEPVSAPPPEVDDFEREWPLKVVPAPAGPANRATRRVPFFVKDLVEKKIFAEHAVARPLSRTNVARGRTVRIIQGSAAVLALVLATGSAFAYRRITVNRELLGKALRDVHNQTVDGKTLLLDLNKADQVSFRSVFLPASLSSPLNADVTEVMTHACSTWVLEIIRRDLMQRKLEVFPRADGEADDSADGGEAEPATLVAIPENTEAYQRLRDLTGRLKTFRDAVDAYETRRSGGSRDERVSRLLEYVGLGQVQPSGHLKEALRRATGSPVIIAPEEHRQVSGAYARLVTEMYEDWATNNALADHVGKMRQSLAELEQGRVRTREQLLLMRARISQVDADLRSPDYRWAAAAVLAVPPAMQRALVNPVAGPGSDTVAEHSRQTGQRYLDELRHRILDPQTAMTGPLIHAEPLALSSGVSRLQVALENALNLRFMKDVLRADPIQLTYGNNQRLMWRIEPLQEAIRLHDIYREFQQVALRGAPPALQLPLGRLAAEQMKLSVQELISQAQTVGPRPVAGGLNNEDETLPEVTRFREATEPLLQLADRMKTDAVDIRNAILRIMIFQAYHLLEGLERRLAGYRPYSMNENNWAGTGVLSLAMFDQRSPAAMTEYLASQRDRIRFLELQAQPLVPFLKEYMPVRAETQNRLIARWERIIEDFRQYENKRPGATLAALEEFIVKEMDAIPASSCRGAGAPPDPGQDFFAQLHGDLYQAAAARCRDVSAASVCRSYSSIARLFNEKLAGKFPFAKLAAGKTQPEAAPEDIAAFYKELDRNVKLARGFLVEDARFGAAAQHAIDFLDQVERLKPLVIPSTPETEKEPPLTLDFTPVMRVNRGSETGGNQIIDWTMQVGGQIFQLRQPEHPGRWRPGNPIRLSLRWAKDSGLMPIDDGQPDMRIIDRNAFFESTGRWALLSFLARHAGSVTEATQSGGVTSYTLRFRVKTDLDPQRSSGRQAPAVEPAVVFLQLRLMPAGGKVPVALPPFPVIAPTLRSSCEQY